MEWLDLDHPDLQFETPVLLTDGKYRVIGRLESKTQTAKEISYEFLEGDSSYETVWFSVKKWAPLLPLPVIKSTPT